MPSQENRLGAADFSPITVAAQSISAQKYSISDEHRRKFGSLVLQERKKARVRSLASGINYARRE